MAAGGSSRSRLAVGRAARVGQLQAGQQGSIVIAVRCQRQVQFRRQIGTESCHRVDSQAYQREILSGTWLLGQQVLRAGIADISGIANITDITDVVDIVTDIADIAMDIADIVNIRILRWRQVGAYKVLLGCPVTECS